MTKASSILCSSPTSMELFMLIDSPSDKSAYWKIILLNSQPSMCEVLKRTVSMRGFFRAPKTHVKTDG